MVQLPDENNTVISQYFRPHVFIASGTRCIWTVHQLSTQRTKFKFLRSLKLLVPVDSCQMPRCAFQDYANATKEYKRDREKKGQKGFTASSLPNVDTLMRLCMQVVCGSILTSPPCFSVPTNLPGNKVLRPKKSSDSNLFSLDSFQHAPISWFHLDLCLTRRKTKS